MSDEAIDTKKPAALSEENFDVLSWLGGTIYGGKQTEVFRSGDKLTELAELLEFVEREESETVQRQRNLTQQANAITDADSPEQLLAQAKVQVESILEELKGTGLTIKFRGLAPGEREVIENKLARTLKPQPARTELIPTNPEEPNGENERVEIEPAHGGGKRHPDYLSKLTNILVEKCVVELRADGRIVGTSLSDDEVVALKGQLLGPEWRRLANAVFDANYQSYDIDKHVTVDF